MHINASTQIMIISLPSVKLNRSLSSLEASRTEAGWYYKKALQSTVSVSLKDPRDCPFHLWESSVQFTDSGYEVPSKRGPLSCNSPNTECKGMVAPWKVRTVRSVLHYISIHLEYSKAHPHPNQVIPAYKLQKRHALIVSWVEWLWTTVCLSAMCLTEWNLGYYRQLSLGSVLHTKRKNNEIEGNQT